MDFCDLKTQYTRLSGPIKTAIEKVLDHGQYIMGPEVQALESTLAEFCGVSHCVSCASGTDALMMVLMACDIGPGDKVLTTPFTFVATAEPIQLLGATPVFVDVDPRTMNICPKAVEKALETHGAADFKAIIAVDLFGRPADYPALSKIAKAHQLTLIADGAQSMGAQLDGRSPMALADYGTTSFYPAKPLGAYGDGGATFCQQDDQAERLRSIRVHGKGKHKYENVRVGINGRLDTIQAAVLLEKFKSFPQELEHRDQVAQAYERLLAPFADWLSVPERPSHVRSAWAQYTVVCKDAATRSSFREQLQAKGMPSVVYYPNPLHLSPAFASLGYKAQDLPHSEWLSERVMSLPMGPDCRIEEIESILGTLDASCLRAA